VQHHDVGGNRCRKLWRLGCSRTHSFGFESSSCRGGCSGIVLACAGLVLWSVRRRFCGVFYEGSVECSAKVLWSVRRRFCGVGLNGVIKSVLNTI
jgi:hypothetical protein